MLNYNKTKEWESHIELFVATHGEFIYFNNNNIISILLLLLLFVVVDVKNNRYNKGMKWRELERLELRNVWEQVLLSCWSHNVNTFYWSLQGPTIKLNIWIVLNWIRVMCVAFSAIFKVVIVNKWVRKNGWLLLSKVEKGRWKMRLGHFGRHHTWCWLWLDCMYLSDVYICQRRRGYCVRYTYIAPQFLRCGPRLLSITFIHTHQHSSLHEIII